MAEERHQMQATIDRAVSSALAQRYVSDCVSACETRCHVIVVLHHKLWNVTLLDCTLWVHPIPETVYSFIIIVVYV
jgi:hypothetical protein